MSKILQLDEHLANMIAAGEVVERPSSVVKELVENAIDADATHIEIHLKDSGVEEIVVKDDGCGMAREDAKLCFSRHATSKIKNEYDLFRIQTLGFRGEAIPSIASVSTFTLLTNDGFVGTKVIYKGGHLEDISDASLNKGTTISVKGLFYNVPARLKYLKTLPQELASISYLVSKFILANPHISFTLTNNGRTIYKTLGNNDMMRIFGELYGLEVARNLISNSVEGHGFKANLTIVKSTISRSNKLEITTIINNRYVKSYPITEAVIEGYHTYIPEGRYPIALINITLDPTLVDVNVHPTKMQIKISNEEEISSSIRKIISSMLKEVSLIPEVNKDLTKSQALAYTKPTIFDSDMKEDIPNETRKEETLANPYQELVKKREEERLNETNEIHSKLDDILNRFTFEEEQTKESELKEEVAPRKKDTPSKNTKQELPYLEYCGQVHGTYLIFQNSEGMYLVDQHAAAERINYEYYLDVLSHPSPYAKPLLIPVNLAFTQSELISFTEHLAYFIDLGFKIDSSGPSSYFIREIPVWLHLDDTEDFILKTLSLMQEDKTYSIQKYRDNIAASIACKASIKANAALTREEIDTMMMKLGKCENPYTCPHGRPTIVKFTTLELEKLFKRVV